VFGYVIYEHRESLKRLPDSIWKRASIYHVWSRSNSVGKELVALKEDLRVELRIGADIPVATSATLHLLALQLVVSQISSKVVRIASGDRKQGMART
jgi:hypothetical protein